MVHSLLLHVSAKRFFDPYFREDSKNTPNLLMFVFFGVRSRKRPTQAQPRPIFVADATLMFIRKLLMVPIV